MKILKSKIINREYRIEEKRFLLVISSINGIISDFHLYLKHKGRNNVAADSMNRETLILLKDAIQKILKDSND